MRAAATSALQPLRAASSRAERAPGAPTQVMGSCGFVTTIVPLAFRPADGTLDVVAPRVIVPAGSPGARHRSDRKPWTRTRDAVAAR
jgi:hypothetical protein